MNVSRLLETCNLLLGLDNKLVIQGKLNELINALSNLTNNPSDQNHQLNFSNAMKSFRVSFADLRRTLEPQKHRYINEVGAREFFLDDLPRDILNDVADNPGAPATALNKITQLSQKRQEYLSQLQSLASALQYMGFAIHDLQPGEAEIGFLIPRTLFGNDLAGLRSELKEIDFIIRGFAEIENRSGEQIIVRQISTSDPQFFFTLNPKVIAAIAAAITWGLGTWKQVEKIRLIRAQIENTPQLQTNKDVTQGIEKSIEDTIKKAVSDKTEELIAKLENQNGRRQEQEAHIKHALESILSRLENGMQVEVRALPREHAATEASHDSENDAFFEISELQEKLEFPIIEGSKTLGIPYND